MVFGTLLNGMYFRQCNWWLIYWYDLHAGIGVLESYTERVSRLRNFEYGKARMWGSLGWATATFFAGRNINVNPDYILLWQLFQAYYF